MARRIGDKRTLAYALAAYNAANHSPTFTRKQVTLATELIQLAMEVGDLERAAEGHEQRAAALIELGELKRAKADVAALAELAEELRQPSQEAFAAAYRALLALLEGDFAEAEALIAELRRVADRAQIGARRSSTTSSCTCFAANRAGSGRSQTSFETAWSDTRPTRSGAASLRRWRPSWATRRKRAKRSKPSPPTASRSCPSTRRGLPA